MKANPYVAEGQRFPNSSKNYHRDFPSHCGPTSDQNSGKKRSCMQQSSPPLRPEDQKWWRKASAVKSKPSPYENLKKTHVLKSSDHPNMHEFNDEVGDERNRVKAKLEMFRKKCKEVSMVSLEKRGTHRVDCKAMKELRKQGELPKIDVIMGSIPGIEVNDRFEYRVELVIVGLHRRNQNGIDYCDWKGMPIATCVVATEGYSDKMDDSEVLTYTGEGGVVGVKDGECPKDQRLVRGNLALKNSIKVKNDVRVVRGVRYGTRFGDSRPKTTYVYDGLYKVVDMKEIRGLKNNLMFEFKLRRNPGQPAVQWQKFK